VVGNIIHGYVGIVSTSNKTRISNNVINGTGVGINLGGYRQTVTNNTVLGGRFGGGTDILECTGSYNNITSNSFSGYTYVGVVLGGSYNFFEQNTITKGEKMRVTGEGNVVIENKLLAMGIAIEGSNHIVCANNISGALSFYRNSSNNICCWNHRKHNNFNDIDGFSPDTINESIKYANMGNWIQIFDAGTWEWTQYNVDLVSNSIVSDFSFNPEAITIQFTVEGETGKTGFCRATIPKDLLHTANIWNVLVDGEPVTSTAYKDPVNAYIYFTYQHSTKNIEIIGTTAIPEFPSWIILPLILAYATTIILAKKKIPQKSRKRK
jgi:parallel beta-helix repeat protein